MAKHDEPRQPQSSSIRDALMNKARGTERDAPPSPQVTPQEIGSISVAHEDSVLSREITLTGPSYLDLAVFCRQFAMLIEVGIPVLKALQMLAARTSNNKLRVAVERAALGVEEGQPIHQAMGVNTRVFTPLVINIIRIGELGGILETSLVRLAEIMENKAKIKRQIISASMYPIVALLVAVAVIVVIMLKAIPTFSSVYAQLKTPLPGITEFIIGVSDFFVAAWPFLLVFAVLAIIGLKIWSRTPGGAYTFSWFALRVPIFKDINQDIGVSRFAHTLGGLITAGIPLLDALLIAADTNENLLIRGRLRVVRDNVEKGERMGEHLGRAAVFPPLVVDMVAIGEETGTLDRMLVKIAEIYDAKVDAKLTGLASIIEPVLIVFLGGIVITIALAVLLPYFNLVSAID